MKKSGPEGGHPRSPTDVDRLVGENVRRRRIQLNLTLSQLAAELGISHQQLQKYETGANRLSAGMLCNLAGRLGVSIESLFDGDEAAARPSPSLEEAALAELRNEGSYWLGRVQSEYKLRQIVEVLKALSSDS
jgi:transcriptional regulator with XRE-family HTH domain